MNGHKGTKVYHNQVNSGFEGGYEMDKQIVGIYVRVSTPGQAEEGYSIDEQVDKLTKFCDVKDWQVAKVYKDAGFSGSNIKRPGMQLMMDDVKEHRINTVLVYKLDRLSRSQKDTLFLIEDVFNKNDCSFISLNENFDTSTAFGKAMVGILSVFAQLEREQITQRMQMGRVGRAKAGLFNGSQVPYGYDYVDSRLVPNPITAPIVREIFDDYNHGYSVDKLKMKYDSAGHVGRKLPWSYHVLRYLLTNRTYIGEVAYGKKWYPGIQKPIVDEVVFDETQRQLAVRQIKNAKLTNNPRPFRAKYMLSGLLRCGLCGSWFDVSISKAHKDRSVLNRYYTCHHRKPSALLKEGLNPEERCISKTYVLSDLEHKVMKKILELAYDPQRVDKLLNANGHVIDDPTPLKRRIRDISNELGRIMELYTAGSVPLDVINTKANQLTQERINLQERVQKITDETNTESISTIRETLESAKTIMKTGSYEERTDVVRKLIKKIVLKGDRMAIEWRFN
jgi:site-specific DNA recombinase